MLLSVVSCHLQGMWYGLVTSPSHPQSPQFVQEDGSFTRSRAWLFSMKLSGGILFIEILFIYHQIHPFKVYTQWF